MNTYACGLPQRRLTEWRDEGAIFSYHINNQWDTMFAPDLVEIKRKDGTKDYVSLSSLPRIQACESRSAKAATLWSFSLPSTSMQMKREELPGSILDFDPSVYIENITDRRESRLRHRIQSIRLLGIPTFISRTTRP